MLLVYGGHGFNGIMAAGSSNEPEHTSIKHTPPLINILV